MATRSNLRRPAAALAILVTLALAPTSASGQATDLKVMSFNVRYSRGVPQEAATENDWADPKYPRRERAIRVIRQYMPDVLGVQEARDLQVADLREALPEYDFYGVGRDDGKTAGECAGIFYRKDRFARSDAGTFWLSATPDEPGTSFYTRPGAVPRCASWLKLRHQPSGRELLVLNTHFDHISAAARRKSAEAIRERLPKLAGTAPAVVMGDLNSAEDSAPLRTLLAEAAPPARQLLDSYRTLHPRRSPDESSFNHWQGTTAGSRIDFILHTADLTPMAAAIVRTSYGGRWPSDHYPITAELRLAR